MNDRVSIALNLPVVATYNLRSLMPNIRNLRTDLLERKIDLAFLQEIWEQSENTDHIHEIEEMLEIRQIAVYFKSTKTKS